MAALSIIPPSLGVWRDEHLFTMKTFNWFSEHGVFFTSSTIGEGHRGGKNAASLPLASLWQKHSSILIHANDSGTYEGDGLITSKKGLYLGVVSADCLPILFFDPRQKKIAIIHAGWKGLLDGFPALVLEEHFATDISNLMIGIGLHICQAHYEVENPAQQNIAAWSSFLKPSPKRGNFFVDLEGYLKQVFLEKGVKKRNIFSSGLCTFEEKGKHGFFSRRRGDEHHFITLASLLPKRITLH